MNIIVRRDVGDFHVLGGGSSNETTHYEFEAGVKIDPGYHVYQVSTFIFVSLSTF